MGVIGYGDVDVERQFEGGAALGGCDAWRGASSNRGQEVFDFQAERFGFFDGKFLKRQAL